MKANQKNETLFLNLVTTGRLLIQPDGTILNTVTLKVYDKRSRTGHVPIAVKVHGIVRHILAHRLIWLALKGPLDEDDHVVHLDGVKWNNRLDNLVKMDSSDTSLHSYALGLNDKEVLSEKMLEFYDFHLHSFCKLSQPQIIEIRNRVAAGETRYRLAKEFGMEWKAIRNIVESRGSYRSVKPAQITPAE